MVINTKICYNILIKGGFTMSSIKILRIRYENIPLFHDGRFDFSLMAEDRVSNPAQVFQLRKNLYAQKLAALVGINA